MGINIWGKVSIRAMEPEALSVITMDPNIGNKGEVL